MTMEAAQTRKPTVQQRLPVFQKFIDDVRAAWARESDTEARMKATTELLRGLVADETIRAHSRDWPSTEGHKNLLLYEDPDYGFAVNAVVRTPGRKGSVHDHAHAWTAYGVLDGTESLERFERLDDGSREGYADVRMTGVTQGKGGSVDLVPPFDIHAEQGGPTRSVAIIVRSERVAGKVLQGRYNPAAKTTHKGEGPTQVPFEVV
jgi:predicted metal-dependent enzyme (double-stranded beta helix superfamily)